VYVLLGRAVTEYRWGGSRNIPFMRHKFLVLTVKKWLKSVYIYGSYRKIKTGVSLFLDHSVVADFGDCCRIVLSTLATIIANFGDCCPIRRQSPSFSATTVAVFGDMRANCRFWRLYVPNSATIEGRFDWHNIRSMFRTSVCQLCRW